MKIRVKMRQMPGDISKQEKIAMMESTIKHRKKLERVHSKAVDASWRKIPSNSSVKNWKKTIRSRERAVQKVRCRGEIW